MNFNKKPASLYAKIRSNPYISLIMGTQLEKLVEDPNTNREKLLTAVNFLMDFALTCDFHNYDNNDLELLGSLIMKSFTYVCKNNTLEVLSLVSNIITFDLQSSAMLYKPLLVRNRRNFVKATMVGLRQFTWTKENIEDVEGSCDEFCCTLLLFMVHHIDFSSVGYIPLAKSFITILEKQKDNISSQSKHTIFLFIMSKVLQSRMGIKPYLPKVIDTILQFIDDDVLQQYFELLIRYDSHNDPSSYIVIEAYIKRLPLFILKKYRFEIGSKISVGISNQSSATLCRKIVKALVSKVTFQDCVEIFFAGHVSLIEDFFDESQRVIYQTNKITHIYTVALAYFKEVFFNFIKRHATIVEVSHLVLVGVQHGYIKVLENDKFIEEIFFADLKETSVNSFKTICCFLKKNDILSSWHLELFGDFIDNMTLNILMEVRRDIKFFLSHLFVQLKVVKNEDLLDDYKDFLIFINELAFTYIKEKVNTAKAIFIYVILVSIFVNKIIKSRYKLTEEEINFIQAGTETGCFVYESLYHDDILENLKNEFLAGYLNTNMMLIFFQDIYLPQLTRKGHYYLFVWAYHQIELGNVPRVEDLAKLIFLQLQITMVQDRQLYRSMMKHITTNINNGLDPNGTFPKYSKIALFALAHKEGLCEDVEMHTMGSICHKLIRNFSFILNNMSEMKNRQKIVKFLMSKSLCFLDFQYLIRYGFCFIGNFVMVIRHPGVISGALEISNIIISSLHLTTPITEAAVVLRSICINIMYPDEDCGIKPICNRSMSFVVEVLSDNEVSDNFLVTSFNCLAALIEDRTVVLSGHTFKVQYIHTYIHIFAKPNWKLKKTTLLRDVQLRLLGQPCSNCTINVEVVYFLCSKVFRLFFRLPEEFK